MRSCCWETLTRRCDGYPSKPAFDQLQWGLVVLKTKWSNMSCNVHVPVVSIVFLSPLLRLMYATQYTTTYEWVLPYVMHGHASPRIAHKPCPRVQVAYAHDAKSSIPFVLRYIALENKQTYRNR